MTKPALPSFATTVDWLKSRFAPIAVEILLIAIIWLSLLKLPAPPSSGLDPSWRMVIGQALLHEFQWGTELVFTYGPLGYLLASTNHGANYTDFLVWQGLSNLVFALTIWLFGRHFTGGRKTVFYAYFVLFVGNYIDAMHITMVLLLALALLHEYVFSRRWLVALGGCALGFLSLIKFTNLMLAGFTLVCVLAWHATQRRWHLAALAGVACALTFLVGWLGCGQNPANIPAYLSTSLNSSSGYGDGMSLYEDRLSFWIGILSCLSLGAYYLLSLWRRTDFGRAFTTMLLLAAYSFINWKHGFTRADGHVFAHYIACLLIPVTFPVLNFDDGPLRPLKATLLTLTAAFSIAGIYVMLPLALTDAPATWNFNLKRSVNALRDLSDLKAMARKDFSEVARGHLMAATKRAVGSDSIDMLGNEQAYVLFNRLNYLPRPAFQTYLPFTAEMLRLNEQFYQSDRAPKFVLQKMDTIDYRLPALEDSLATRYIYYHYRYVLEEKGMLLWARVTHDPKRDEKTLVEEKTVGFGEAIPVPNLGETSIWAEIEVRPTVIGSIRSFLYKSPIITLGVREGEFKNNYRIIRRMASAGFLAFPHFTNAGNVKNYMSGEPAPRADSFTVELPEAQRYCYQPGITVRFYSLPPMPRHAGIDAGPTDEVYRMFDRKPSAAKSFYPVTILVEDGQEVLFAHPPSELEFLINFPAKRLTGRFGLAENSYTPPNATDGAEFIIDWVSPEGQTRRLMSRVLQPTTITSDRGMQHFQVDVPQGGGRMLLKITAGPNDNQAFDWTYWTDLKFRE